MVNKDCPKIIIIDESIVESTTLMILLSTLTKNLTICSNYSCGLASIQNAIETNSPFDIVFMVYPPNHHEEYDLAIQVLALALQNGDPSHTIILGGEQLPPQFQDKISESSNNILSKPISRQKLQDTLAPLKRTLPKLNCWEYMNCGRQPGGRHAEDRGICPATMEQAAEGIHGGKNAGRVCWAQSGTLCGGSVQGSFACKIKNCMICDFYKLVEAEEAEIFESIDSIFNRMKRKKRTT